MEHYDVIDCIPKEKEAVLECGTGNGSRTFASSSDQPFQIAHVTIDLGHLCKPIVNIEFSSTVKFEIDVSGGGSGIIRLQYELLSSCDGGEPVSRGVWMFQKIIGTLIDHVETTSFDFNYCECFTCSGCCEYFVVVKLVQFLENQSNTKATVSNGRIAALANEA